MANRVVTDTDIDAALSEFGGDPRAAIAALLHDIGVLAADQEVMAANVSTGFLRRLQPPPKTIVRVKTTEKVTVIPARQA